MTRDLLPMVLHQFVLFDPSLLVQGPHLAAFDPEAAINKLVTLLIRIGGGLVTLMMVWNLIQQLKESQKDIGLIVGEIFLSAVMLLVIVNAQAVLQWASLLMS